MDIEAKKKELDERQLIIDEKYEKEGLTDEVLDLQVALNMERNALNITDERQIINSEGFVQ